jgi:hypothetical protein
MGNFFLDRSRDSPKLTGRELPGYDVEVASKRRADGVRLGKS